MKATIIAPGGIVAEDKIGSVGMSQVGPDTTKKVNAISLVSLNYLSLALATRHQAPCTNGVSTLAHWPLGRGFLTGNITKVGEVVE